MGFFTKKEDMNNVDLANCNPIIINQTQSSIVIFMDRGVLYNKQILAPGEAVGMTRQDTAGSMVPYKIHAVVGDDKSLPTRLQSVKNLMSTAAIPTAFIVGTFMAASTAGTSKAVSRAAGGIIVRGMVIDSAALAAGSIAANRATMIAERLIEEKPKNFFAKSGHCMPGKQFVSIQGGIEEPLTINFMKEKAFRQIVINGELKTPMDTFQDKIDYYVPSMLRSSRKGPTQEEIQALEADEADAILPAITEQQTDEAAVERPPATNPSASVAAQTEEEESEEDRDLRLAIAASKEPAVSSEDEQLRLAIEASLKLEEDKKKQQEVYNKRLNDKRSPVKLF